MTTVLLFAPLALTVCLVLALLKEEKPKTVVLTALKNFAILTGVLAAGCVMVFALGRYL